MNSEKIWKIQRTWSTTQHIRKQPKKGQETPTSGCAWAHPSTPSGSLPVAMVLVLLYYYYSKKKVRETEKKVREKSTGEKKVREKKSTGKKVRQKSTGKKSTGEKNTGEKSTGKKITGGKPGMRRTCFRKKVRETEKKGGEKGREPNFRLRMCPPEGTPFGVTSLPVAPPPQHHHRKCDLNCAPILLVTYMATEGEFVSPII